MLKSYEVLHATAFSCAVGVVDGVEDISMFAFVSYASGIKKNESGNFKKAHASLSFSLPPVPEREDPEECPQDWC